MSEANVQLVRALQPRDGVDVVVLFNDPDSWTRFTAAAGQAFVDDFECAGVGLPQGNLEARGIDGLRELWVEWLGPWSSYRNTVEDVIGEGDRVMVLVHDRAVSRHDGVEVEIRAASVWTLCDGKVARVEFHATRESARAAFEA